MATPMAGPGTCCLCWQPHEGGTFEFAPGGDLTLVDVCWICRWFETFWAIRRASW